MNINSDNANSLCDIDCRKKKNTSLFVKKRFVLSPVSSSLELPVSLAKLLCTVLCPLVSHLYFISY